MKLLRLISKILGMLLMASTWIGGIGIGFYVLFESFAIVSYVFGDIVAFLSLIIAPVLMGIAPWYLVFRYGEWSLLILAYGTIPVMMMLLGLSALLLEFGDSDSDS